MSMDVRLLHRCLRQLADAGCDALFLDALTPDEALALARAAQRRARPQPAASGAATGESSAAEGPHAAANAGRATLARVRETLQREAELTRRPAAVEVRPAAESGVAAEPAAGGSAAPGAAASLTVLAAEAAGCVRCRLHESRRTVVFGEGPASAEIVVIGEAPGGEEDRTGRPFVGPAGRLLDLLLMTAGFPRERTYICNVLKCRPPQNRNPLEDEVAACTGTWLHPQLEAIAPRVMVAVGKFAAQSLLRTEESIGRLRGRVHAYQGTPLVVSYHPAFLLRSPHMSRVAWHDFQLVRQVFDEQG